MMAVSRCSYWGRAALPQAFVAVLRGTASADQMVGVGNVPDNLARVTISPTGLNGNRRAGAGGTQNFRFRDNQQVTVEAPAEHNGKTFRRWRIQAGSEPVFRTQRRVTVTVDKGNDLFVSEYGDGSAAVPSPMVPFAAMPHGLEGTGNAAADVALAFSAV